MDYAILGIAAAAGVAVAIARPLSVVVSCPLAAVAGVVVELKAPASPLWMGVAITTFLLAGLVVVVTNYLGLLPGDAENRYLIIGLVLISTGFMMATGYR